MEELLVLFEDAVAGLGKDFDEGFDVEAAEGAGYGKAADEFGDEAEFLEVLGLDEVEGVVDSFLLGRVTFFCAFFR